MRGIKSENLSAMVDFLYYGEANVFQENLDSFLAIADELQLKGLMMGKTDEQTFEVDEKYLPSTLTPASSTDTKIPKTSFKSSKSINIEENIPLAIPSNFSGNLEELEERVKSMMEKSLNKTGHQLAYICKVCGKEGVGSNIKDHIEKNHLEGITIPCNICDKTFRSRKIWMQHIMRQHQNK